MGARQRAFNPNGERRFSIRGTCRSPFALVQRRTTMSKTTARTVCRLCGGSGLPQQPVVVAKKLPALCTAFVRPSADVVVLLPQALPLAA